MARSISEYVASEEFRTKMKRVSAQSRPFGNSTSSERIYEMLAQAAREREAKIKAEK